MEHDNENSSYKSIIKSTAIFGGAQAIQMLITILRAKLIAVLLGSQGMGVNAIFQSTIAIITSFSSFGIFQSAVRDISQAHESGDGQKLSKINLIFVRMVWFTGLLGMLICLLGSFWLSKFAFGNGSYTWHFILLSAALFFGSLSNGKTSFLEGTRNLTYLAKASIIGAFLSLIIGVLLFYYLGTMGIVFSIISSSLFLYLSQSYFTKRIKLEKVDNLTIIQTINQGKPIAKLGSVLMFGMVTMTAFTYFTNIFIGRYGKIADVGLFQGVSSITTQSIAVVIAVLASDFFPRLSSVFQDQDKVKVMVNQQAELISLIIAPIMVLLIIFAHLIIRILLSNEFIMVVPMLRWMALSLLVRGIWLIMSYIILARGDRKIYFIYDALIGNGLLFICNIVAYAHWGLQGLGVSFLIGSIIVCTVLFMVVKIRYGFNFNLKFIQIFVIMMTLVICSYLVMYLTTGWLQYGLSFVIVIAISLYSFKILDNRIGILKMLKLKHSNSLNQIEVLKT